MLKLAKLSVGSVLREADPFITLAPLHSPVEAEVHISTREIGFVRDNFGAWPQRRRARSDSFRL